MSWELWWQITIWLVIVILGCLLVKAGEKGK